MLKTRIDRFLASLGFIGRSKDEMEFLPAALELIETPASPAGRALGAIIILFFITALLWAIFGSVDIIATARGKVIPTGHTKVIQPLENGVVRAIHVQDGQKVKAGDVLIEIDSTINEAERDRIQKDFVLAQLDMARLKAALGFTASKEPALIVPEGATPAQTELQHTQLVAQTAEIRAKLSGLDRQITQNEGNREAVLSTIDKITKTIPLLKKQSDMREELARKGYGSKILALTAEQDLIEHEQELKVQRGRLAEAEGGVSNLKEQRTQAENEYKRTTMSDLAQAQQKAASLQEQLLQATQKYRLQTLTSPVDGTVQQLAVHTEGGVVTPAQALLAVVPADSHLEIEAAISNRDIGFVHAGQAAEVKIDTFNFTKYGLLHGHVDAISRDAVTRENPGTKNNKVQEGAESDSSEPFGQELVYTARVSLETTEIQIDGRMVSLAPGMAVTAEIKTGSRHVIEYLLSPIMKYKHQALRER